MLKFTTITPFTENTAAQDMTKIQLLVTPPDNAVLKSCEVKGRNAYIVGKALQLAGFSLPCFYDGDITELDKDDGLIIMVLPSGEYPISCKLNRFNNYTLDLK